MDTADDFYFARFCFLGFIIFPDGRNRPKESAGAPALEKTEKQGVTTCTVKKLYCMGEISAEKL